KTKAETIANTMAHLAFAEFHENPDNPEAVAGTFNDILGGTGTIAVEIVPVAPFLINQIITATGTFGEESAKVVVRTKRRPFSICSYFTVIEPTIYFVTGDILNGPVHTNGTIHIDGDPIFNGPVTASKGCEGCNPKEYDDEFKGGFD